MSELKHVLQWVTISVPNNYAELSEENFPITTYQFDENGNQKNISHVLNLAEEDKLNVLIAIPVDAKLEAVKKPFIIIDMKSGAMNINGTEWNFLPHGIDPNTVKFRPIWYHSVRKDFSADSMTEIGQELTLYKIGWQFTHEDKNYQRVIFWDVKTGVFSLKEKR